MSWQAAHDALPVGAHRWALELRTKRSRLSRGVAGWQVGAKGTLQLQLRDPELSEHLEALQQQLLERLPERVGGVPLEGIVIEFTIQLLRSCERPRGSRARWRAT